MEYKNLERLEKIRERNADPNWINDDLYRLLYKPDLFIVAYEKIKSKPGNMTPGIDGTTLDRFSSKEIDRIISKLRDESYQPLKARTVNIPKTNGGHRTLRIAPPREKIIQEAIRMILEAIYDSPHGATFSNASHGFRSKRGCHTALSSIRSEWSGVVWGIEGDIKSCFDDIDHNILIGLLRKRIRDERFLNLIRKILKAGYVEFNVPKHSIAGTPQGGVMSPILANVYLHELDMYVDTIQKKYETGKLRRPHLPYKRLVYKRNKAKQANDKEEVKRIEKEMRKMPSTDPNDPNFIRVKYIRYADDWIIGLIGPKKLAEEIKEKVKHFLHDNLKLTLSEDKTRITNLKNEEMKFLGTRITRKGKSARYAKVENDNTKYRKRATGIKPRLLAPIGEIVRKLHTEGMCDDKGFPCSKPAWTTMDPDQIIQRYDSTLWGILNYYNFAGNYGDLNRIQYIIQYSAAKTLAHKYKTSMKKIFQRHGNSLTVPCGEKQKGLKLQVNWKNTGTFLINPKTKEDLSNDRLNIIYHRLRTSSKLENPCSICGETENVQMHHVRHLRKRKKRKESDFTNVMIALNRKQVPVCHECHRMIHAGKYDGTKIGNLA